MKVVAFGKTDAGRCKTINEDAILVDNDRGMYAVCDGVGGHAAGEIAAQKAAELTRSIVQREAQKIDELRKGTTPDSEAIQFMESLICEVSVKIYELANTRPEYCRMGTAMTVLLVVGDRALMGHVGPEPGARPECCRLRGFRA